MKIEPVIQLESKTTSKYPKISENTSNEFSDTYEEYAENNPYEVNKLEDSYEDYMEKYQDYGHFQKFQTSKISNESSENSS